MKRVKTKQRPQILFTGVNLQDGLSGSRDTLMRQLSWGLDYETYEFLRRELYYPVSDSLYLGVDPQITAYIKPIR